MKQIQLEGRTKVAELEANWNEPRDKKFVEAKQELIKKYADQIRALLSEHHQAKAKWLYEMF